MTGTPPDAELVRSAKGGDRDAMDALVRRHHAVVFRTVIGILEDEDDAADATQETFIKAFRGLEGFRGAAKFRTWLLSIAINEARGSLRRAARRRESSFEQVDHRLSEAPRALERIEASDRIDQMRERLERLPEKQRLAVSLRVFDGLSFREIGAAIESSEGAARVNFHHGVRKLREWMEDER